MKSENYFNVALPQYCLINVNKSCDDNKIIQRRKLSTNPTEQSRSLNGSN